MSNKHTIENFWYSHSKIKLILWPLNLFFLTLVLLKRALYQLGLIKSNQFKKPVLVVGNISIGGTGKTPFINQLVRVLLINGIQPGIVSRGYQSQTSNLPHLVTNADSVQQIGDEAYMQHANLNRNSALNIPLVIDPNRSRAVEYLIEQCNVDIVISDDGMQHYQMTRAIEVLLFDGARQFGNQLILPLGPLREPVSRLRTVDIVVQNGCQNNHYSDNSVVLRPCVFVNLKTGLEISLEQFSDKVVHAVAGIGNPQRFFKTLANLCKIKTNTRFSDHYSFKSSDFDDFSNEIVVMTEKDASKCYSFANENCYYLKVEMEFDVKLTDTLLDAVKKSIKLHPKIEQSLI